MKKSLQEILHGRTDNLKLDRWSLELKGRNMQVEHIPGYKNKAADCLSRLPFVTRKRNENPLKDEISINMTGPQVNYLNQGNWAISVTEPTKWKLNALIIPILKHFNHP